MNFSFIPKLDFKSSETQDRDNQGNSKDTVKQNKQGHSLIARECGGYLSKPFPVSWSQPSTTVQMPQKDLTA